MKFPYGKRRLMSGARVGLAAAVAAAVGLYLLAAGSASTVSVAVEAEHGQTSGGAAVMGLADASGSAVTFGKEGMAVAAEEFLGPFPSWGDIKSRYGAAGNGVADDSNALQAALDDVGSGNGAPDTVYLPPGTYRITRQLSLTSKIGVGLIGDDAATTRIIWDGPAGGTMLVTDAAAYSRYGRITWDGNNKAGVGVAHWYRYAPGRLYASTMHEHADEVFINSKRCLVTGRNDTGYGQLDSELSIQRNRFERCSEAGVSTGSFNALDVWIWDSEFNDNGRAVTNEFGAGNFSIYRSVFRRSTVADVTTHHTQFFGFRNNVSVGSKKFLVSHPIGANSSNTILQGNRIIDTQDTQAIEIGNVGPLMLIDNQIRSATGASGLAVGFRQAADGCALLAVGNSFTVSNPAAANCTGGRALGSGNRTVERTAISDAVPARPQSRKANRPVFEVPAGADAVTIQQVINQAAASGDARPVVHFPTRTYSIDRTLVIPANKGIQLVGDSMMRTVLQWAGNGAGPVIRLEGPTKATLRELTVYGSERATGIAMTGANQPGARLYSEFAYYGKASVAELFFDNAPHVGGELHANVQSFTKGGATAVKVHGGSDVAIFGGGTNIGASGTMYEVRGGGKLLLTDTWYEGAGERQVSLTDSGTFTMQGGHIAPADAVHGGNPSVPSVLVDGFRGKAAFIGMQLDLEHAVNGVQVRSLPAGSGAYFIGLNGTKPDWYSQQQVAGAAGLLLGLTSDHAAGKGSVAIPDVGSLGETSLNDALSHVRGRAIGSPTGLPAGVSDLRLYRVQVENTTNGVHITP